MKTSKISHTVTSTLIDPILSGSESTSKGTAPSFETEVLKYTLL